MPSLFEAEQLRRLGINGAAVGALYLESDGDPNPGYTVRMIRDNRTAIVDPTAANDDSQGYAPGSLWTNLAASRVWWCASAATGVAVWKEVGGFTLPGGGTGGSDLANLLSLRPGRHALGDILRYGPEGAPSASTVQYTRLFLTAGQILDRMETFVASGGAAARLVRIGLYDQAVPLSQTGVPNNRVAQTDALGTGADNGAYKELNLTDAPTGGTGAANVTYTVTVEGYYWVAFIADSAALKYPVTAQVYRPGFITQLFFEAGVGTTLPATATPVVGSASAIAYMAAVEQGA